jgi:hypothetical protein
MLGDFKILSGSQIPAPDEELNLSYEMRGASGYCSPHHIRRAVMRWEIQESCAISWVIKWKFKELDNCVTARLDIQAASWSAEEQNRALQFRDNAWLHKPYRTMPING